MSLLLDFYMRAPFFLKRIFVNVEAIRRDYYRKYGEYEKLYGSIDFCALMTEAGMLKKHELIDSLLLFIRENVAYYRELPKFSTLEELPLMTKSEYAVNQDLLIADGVNKNHCWKSCTSGSTGRPLTYFNHRDNERTVKAYQEKFLEHIGISPGDKSARISGVCITTFDRLKPPYWVYIDKYIQLQLSAYHISPETYAYYIQAMKQHKVRYGTGYTSAWLFLSQYLSKSKENSPDLKAIITDSEGVTLEQQRFIENAFRCPVYQTYGLGELGQIAVQCRKGNYHIVPALCHAEIVDDEGKKLQNGQRGEIVLTNLVSGKTPIVRYRTADYGILEEGKCQCGWNTQYFTLIDGRTDDYVIGNDGQKIGRLSHIIKPAVGVVESQIIQEKIGGIRLLIIPGKKFEVSSMDTVISNAKNYLGDMEIKWEIVDSLERTKSAKVRRVIRKIKA